MELVLTSRERDQAVLALRDVQGILQYAKQPQYAELDEIQTLLAFRGLQIAPIPKTPGLTSAIGDRPAPATTLPALSPNEQYWIESNIIQAYRAFKQQGRPGYVFRNDTMGQLLAIVCKGLGIKFAP